MSVLTMHPKCHMPPLWHECVMNAKSCSQPLRKIYPTMSVINRSPMTPQLKSDTDGYLVYRTMSVISPCMAPASAPSCRLAPSATREVTKA